MKKFVEMVQRTVAGGTRGYLVLEYADAVEVMVLLGLPDAQQRVHAPR